MSKRVKEVARAEPFLGVRDLGGGKSELVAMEPMMEKLEALDDSVKLGVFFLGGPMRDGKLGLQSASASKRCAFGREVFSFLLIVVFVCMLCVPINRARP